MNISSYDEKNKVCAYSTPQSEHWGKNIYSCNQQKIAQKGMNQCAPTINFENFNSVYNRTLVVQTTFNKLLCSIVS